MYVYMHSHVHIMYFCMYTYIRTQVCQRVYNYIYLLLLSFFSHREAILCFYCKHRVFHVRTRLPPSVCQLQFVFVIQVVIYINYVCVKTRNAST
ncbi:hypothetical protein NP493_13g07005 [Ridgeia piscesae]|uniref:Uncharacterized protein n=1 Tax=Ridgeia piscesae TaxID=27915 RepID=A0AAD9PEV2_RIDPI|nr:hypothetical protein NP493_13g07005 [Ridgeia piscesae]